MFTPESLMSKEAPVMKPKLGAFDLNYFHELEGPDGWIALGMKNCRNQKYFTVFDQNGTKLGIAGVFDT